MLTSMLVGMSGAPNVRLVGTGVMPPFPCRIVNLSRRLGDPACRSGASRWPRRRSGRWPVGAEVGVRVVPRPVVQDLRESGGHAAPGGQVLLQDEHEHHVALGGEVRDVLGDNGPA